MKPLNLVKALRRDEAVDPAALDRGKAVLMAAIRQEVEPPRRPTVIPQLPYQDVRAALSFLERAFGFREIVTARLLTAAGAIDHTMVEVGDGAIGIGPEGHHGVITPKRSGSESQYISVYVDDVDAHYQRAVAAGARIAHGLRDYAWGDRTYEAHRTYEAFDLEGHRWRFHEWMRAAPRRGRPGPPGEQ